MTISKFVAFLFVSIFGTALVATTAGRQLQQYLYSSYPLPMSLLFVGAFGLMLSSSSDVFNRYFYYACSIVLEMSMVLIALRGHSKMDMAAQIVMWCFACVGIWMVFLSVFAICEHRQKNRLSPATQ